MSRLRGTRVLVTDGEQRAALAVVRSLGAAGCDVYVCSRARLSLAGTSRYARKQTAVPDPGREPDLYLEALADRCGAWKIDLLIPVTEVSLLLVLRNRARFGPCLVPFGEYETFLTASDKARVAEVASELGFAVPRQERVESLEDRGRLVPEDLSYPLVVKPARSIAVARNRAVSLAPSYAVEPAELLRVLDTLPSEAHPLLLQQRIVGEGAGLFMLRWDGKVRAVFAHRRIREKPPAGGVSVLRESVAAEPGLVRDSAALLEALRWEGVAMVEVKREEGTEVPYLMEINPRFWGSLQLAVDAGVDFPRLLVEAALGHDVEEGDAYRTGVRSRWLWGDVDHLLARLRRSPAELHLPPGHPRRLRVLRDFVGIGAPRSRWEVLRPGDPLPFVLESVLWMTGRST